MCVSTLVWRLGLFRRARELVVSPGLRLPLQTWRVGGPGTVRRWERGSMGLASPLSPFPFEWM